MSSYVSKKTRPLAIIVVIEKRHVKSVNGMGVWRVKFGEITTNNNNATHRNIYVVCLYAFLQFAGQL